MGFMQPEYVSGFWLECTSKHGDTCVLPADIVFSRFRRPEARKIRIAEWRRLVKDYVNFTGEVHGVKIRKGWGYRLSAAGYMDCTEWCGPFATREAAVKDCGEQFECIECGEFDCTCAA
jgi:hypothetical protein